MYRYFRKVLVSIMPLLVTIALLAFTRSALGGGDPTLIINVLKLDITNRDNPYFGKWEADIIPGNPENKISVKISAKQTMPDDMLFRAEVMLDGTEMPGMEDANLCDGFDEEMVLQPMMAALLPAATFPKNCPIQAGAWELKEYVLVKDKLPTPLPEGKATGKVEFYQAGKEPYISGYFEIELKHSIPGLG